MSKVYGESGWVKVGRWCYVMADGVGPHIRVRSEIPCGGMRSQEDYVLVAVDDLFALAGVLNECGEYAMGKDKGDLAVVTSKKRVVSSK